MFATKLVIVLVALTKNGDVICILVICIIEAVSVFYSRLNSIRYHDNVQLQQLIFLFVETKCKSWFGKKYDQICTPNNDRCFNVEKFRPEYCYNSVLTECKRLDAWSNYRLLDSNAFHCTSGDCVPFSSVCDDNKNCDDGSDEKIGCYFSNGSFLCDEKIELFPKCRNLSQNSEKSNYFLPFIQYKFKLKYVALFNLM